MFKKIVLSTALLLSTGVAFAADDSFYAGVSAGSSKFDTIDGRKTSFTGLVGYQFTKELAVEASYGSLGSFKILGADVDTKQTALSLVGSVNVAKDVDLFARVGYNKLKADVSFSGRTGSGSDSGTLFGLGASYRFTENVSARLEWTRPASDTNNIGAAVVFKF